MKKVKIFFATRTHDLELDINRWLKENPSYEIYHDLTRYGMTDYKGYAYSAYLVYIDRS